MEKLTRNSNFSIFHDLRSDFKVSEILRGQSKHGLWGSNLKTGKNFTMGCSGANLDTPFSEPCFLYGHLVGNLNKRHLTLMGWVHRFRIYNINTDIGKFAIGGHLQCGSLG